MKKVSEYQAHADECRKMAQAATNANHRASLLEMAKAWDMMAEVRAKQLRKNANAAAEARIQALPAKTPA